MAFTVAQREALCARLLRRGQDDRAIVAGAVVGSLAAGIADEWSDVDVTFAVAEDASVAGVLDDWTTRLRDEDGAVPLVDLARGPTSYRVFLLPGALQLDLSMTPAAEFRPAGPRFRLEFGVPAAAGADAERGVGTLFIDTPAVAPDTFGWGVVYALHARACIERGRLWQAEHYVGAVRDHALALACLRLGVTAVQARGYDDLPDDVRDRFLPTLVGTLEPPVLRRALATAVAALLAEGLAAPVPAAAVTAERLAGLV